MNWRWSLVAIVVALSLARWAVEATRLGQVAGRQTASPAAPLPAQEIHEYPEGDGELPARYPADVPLMEGAGIMETVLLPKPDRITWNVVFHVDAGPGEIDRWYKAELERRGWNVTRSEVLPKHELTGEPGRVLVALKDGRRLELLWGEAEGEWKRTVSQMLVEPVR